MHQNLFPTCIDFGESFDDNYKHWLRGLKHEIDYWVNAMKDSLWWYAAREFVANGNYSLDNRKFNLEQYIPKSCWAKEYKFIDVGSGPISACGAITNKVQLQWNAIDPLAGVYQYLKKNYGIHVNEHFDFGFAELLYKKYEENTFDMVSMRNSLDHSFDALFGLYNLIYICKIGGKIILEHSENEAAYEDYSGLHQWNFSLNNSERSFVIWRNDLRVDVFRLLGEYVTFEFEQDIPVVLDRGINRVVLTKVRKFEMPTMDYYDRMLEATYGYLIETLTNLSENGVIAGDSETPVKDRPRQLFERILHLYNSPKAVQEKLHRKNVHSVVIYGYGFVGKALEQLLKKYDINITAILDQTPVNDNVMQIKDYSWDKESVLIFTVCGEEDVMKRKAIGKTCDDKYVYFIDDFLNLIE